MPQSFAPAESGDLIFPFSVLSLQVSSSTGGDQPTSTQELRTSSASGSSLRCSAATVARPVGVVPIIWILSSLQVKCADQRCVRGLNSGTVRPVAASKPTVLSLLWPLRDRAGEPEVQLLVGAILRERDHVLDLQARHHQMLRAEAIATAMSCGLSQRRSISAGIARRVTLQLSGGCRPRSTATLSA